MCSNCCRSDHKLRRLRLWSSNRQQRPSCPSGAPAYRQPELTLAGLTARQNPARESRPDPATMDALKAAQEANATMLGELRAMRAHDERAVRNHGFHRKLGRTPSQAALAQKLLDGGFSAVLIRKMLDAMPAEVSSGAADEVQWATQVLQRNLNTADQEPGLEDRTGVFAMIGSTGVGKPPPPPSWPPRLQPSMVRTTWA